MQVSAISSAANFGQAHGGLRADRRLSEEQIQELALKAAVQQDKKRAKGIKKMFYAVPIMAGLAAGILHDGGTKVLSKEISGKAAKLAAGLKSAGNWTAMMATGVGVAVGNSIIAKKSETYKDFRINHPILSFINDILVFTGISMLAPVGLSKLASKMPNQMAKLSRGVESMANHVNDFKTPEFVKNLGSRISNLVPASMKDFGTKVSAYIPDSVRTIGNTAKEIGKGLLSWAPHLTLLTAMFQGLSRNAYFIRDYNNNYANIKQQVEEAQA